MNMRNDRIQYRKRKSFHVTAVRFDLLFDGFEYQKWGHTQQCTNGDWLVNNGGEVYTVDNSYFLNHYQETSPGQYIKVGAVWAQIALDDGATNTLEGKTQYKKGDYIVFDRPIGGEAYAIEKAQFERMYEPVELDEALTQRQHNYLFRIAEQIEWYGAKSDGSKRFFYWFQTIAIISAAAVPVLSSLQQHAFLLAALGGTSAAISSLLSLFQFQTNWIKYRSTCEDLKSHKAQFESKAGPYEDKRLAFDLFVENCERIISTERGQWAQNHSRTIEDKET